jgi:hypothetical protein
LKALACGVGEAQTSASSVIAALMVFLLYDRIVARPK